MAPDLTSTLRCFTHPTATSTVTFDNVTVMITQAGPPPPPLVTTLDVGSPPTRSRTYARLRLHFKLLGPYLGDTDHFPTSISRCPVMENSSPESFHQVDFWAKAW